MPSGRDCFRRNRVAPIDLPILPLPQEAAHGSPFFASSLFEGRTDSQAQLLVAKPRLGTPVPLTR